MTGWASTVDLNAPAFLPGLPPEMLRAASVRVAERSEARPGVTRAEDCRELLGMLGLLPEEPVPVEEGRHGTQAMSRSGCSCGACKRNRAQNASAARMRTA